MFKIQCLIYKERTLTLPSTPTNEEGKKKNEEAEEEGSHTDVVYFYCFHFKCSFNITVIRF